MTMTAPGRRRIALLVATLLAAPLFGAGGSGEEITVIGTLRLVGAEPFTHVVVTTDDDLSYRLPDGALEEHREFLWTRVEVSGRTETHAIRAAEGTFITDETIFTEYRISPAQ